MIGTSAVGAAARRVSPQISTVSPFQQEIKPRFGFRGGISGRPAEGRFAEWPVAAVCLMPPKRTRGGMPAGGDIIFQRPVFS